jgi:hypothetical protein
VRSNLSQLKFPSLLQNNPKTQQLRPLKQPLNRLKRRSNQRSHRTLKLWALLRTQDFPQPQGAAAAEACLLHLLKRVKRGNTKKIKRARKLGSTKRTSISTNNIIIERY